MTIFDVIRWPVNIPPTAEELDAVPTELYRNWIKRSHWRDADTESSYDRFWVAGWMQRNWEDPRNYMVREEIIEDVKLLRKLIAGWKE